MRDRDRRLRESEQRLALAMANADLGWWDHDLVHGRMEWDDRYRAMLGCPAGAIASDHVLRSLVHPEDWPRLEAERRAALDPRGPGDLRVEFRVLREDGRVRWLQVRGRVLFDDSGGARRPVRISGTVADVTERELAIEELRASESRLNLAMANANAGLWDWDLRTGAFAWDARARRLLGFGGDARIDIDSMLARVHPADRDALEGALSGALDSAGSGVCDVEYRVVLPDGDVRWLATKGRVVFQGRGASRHGVRFAGTVTDVTARRHIEEELRTNQALLAESQRIARLGSFTVDLEGGTTWWSDEALRLFGFAPGDRPTVDEMQQRIVPGDRARASESFRERQDGRGDAVVRFRIALADGTERVIERRSHTETSEGGRCLVGTLQDVTEHVAAEERRLELEVRLQRAEKLESMSVLAGGVAHDFNNLLTGVMGNAELALLEIPEGSPARELVENVTIAAARAAELANQMLAYSGRGLFVMKRVAPGQVVDDMLRLLRAGVPRRIELRARTARDVPEIEADPAQLRQVLLNFVTNSAEAIGEREGAVEIRTGRVEVGPDDAVTGADGDPLPPGAYALLEVTDTGPGMDEETRARMFDPFFSTKFTGRGLGLAAVLGIVRGHRGAVQVDSAKGRGTTVRVLFPAAVRAR